MSCTFFGHSNSPLYLSNELERILEKLIAENNVDKFFIGNHGSFDRCAYSVLKKLQKKHRHISVTIVLAYMPTDKINKNYFDYSDSILPDGIENIPKRAAIIYRNNWMIDNSDYVITYIINSSGNAARFAQIANKKGKVCINLAKYNEI